MTNAIKSSGIIAAFAEKDLSDELEKQVPSALGLFVKDPRVASIYKATGKLTAEQIAPAMEAAMKGVLEKVAAGAYATGAV